MICVVFAHPFPSRSEANRALLRSVREQPDVIVRSLYDLYPDFDIDVDAEQKALSGSRGLILINPIFWYSVPGLLKHWFDKVLVPGWAYGEGGSALRGKSCLWVATTGGIEASYRPNGLHGQSFEEFMRPIEQTARFCGMVWLPPLVVYNADELTQPELEKYGQVLVQRSLEMMP